MVALHKHERDGSGNDVDLPFELAGTPEGVPAPGDEQARHMQVGEMARPQTVGPSGRVQRIAHEDERGHFQALGRSHGAHPPAHGTSAHGNPAGGDSESVCQLRGGAADRGDTDVGRVGPAPPGGPTGELDPLDHDAQPTHRVVDRHECRLLTSGTGTGGEHKASRCRIDHCAIMQE